MNGRYGGKIFIGFVIFNKELPEPVKKYQP
jgi:hypothetical protein